MDLEYNVLARLIGHLKLQVMQLQQDNERLRQLNSALEERVRIEAMSRKESDAERSMTEPSTASSATSESSST